MLDYLIERENEEMFRTSVRTLAFPDGEERRVEAYRLIWRWFDRSIAYEFGFTETEILDLALKCAEEEKLPVGQAIGRILDHVIQTSEAEGLDYTDDDLVKLTAKRGLANFNERKAGRS